MSENTPEAFDHLTADEDALITYLTDGTDDDLPSRFVLSGEGNARKLIGPWIIRGDEQDCIGQLCDRFMWQWAPDEYQQTASELWSNGPRLGGEPGPLWAT